MRLFYVYMMTNKRNGTLYVGSTSDLIKRVWEHKNKVIRCAPWKAEGRGV